MNIITLAIQHANDCMQKGKKNIFVKSYDIIKNWLPEQFLSHVNLERERNDKFFVHLDQLAELKASLSGNSTSISIIQYIVNVLKVFEKFAEEITLENQIRGYLHVFEQQVKFVEFLSQVCGESPDYNYIANIIQDCQIVLNNEFKKQVTSLKLDRINNPEYYEKAIKFLDLYPNENECIKTKAQCYSYIGDINISKGKYKQAISNFVKAIELDKKIHDLYEKVGDLLFDQKEYGNALKFFKVMNNVIKVSDCFAELIKLNPQDAHLRVEKGDYFLSIGRLEKAIGCYQQACSLSQDKSFLVTIFNKIAAILREQGQKNALKAQEYSQKAANEDFYNYNEIKAEDLENLQFPIIGNDLINPQENAFI